jgi:hypothetical protein
MITNDQLLEDVMPGSIAYFILNIDANDPEKIFFRELQRQPGIPQRQSAGPQSNAWPVDFPFHTRDSPYVFEW